MSPVRPSDSGWVTSTDGVRLWVTESGPPDAPTVVCLHGYPDDHRVWDPVAAELARRYHVVRYDLRGAGASDKPRGIRHYRLDQLVEDLVAVLDATSPDRDRPVHLLAHDWGGLVAWHALTGQRPPLRDRIASLTSISGPCLDHVRYWYRSRLRRPTPRAVRELLSQLRASWYIVLFRLPLLPELTWRLGIVQRGLVRGGRPGPPPSLSDGICGLALYRANMVRATPDRSPGAGSAGATAGMVPAEVPVQVLAPSRDPAATVSLLTDIGRWVPNLAVRELPAGHWLPVTHPQVVARCAAELIEHAEGGPQARGLRRARRRRTRDRRTRDRRTPRFADQLVVITGGGSGIGRACALEFAEHGAEVVVCDIDQPAAERTALLAGTLGPAAHAYRVDVSDGTAMQRFTDTVGDRHGIPDIVINNAGIGMAGSFFDTTLSDWEEVIDVNLWGVIHGCRALGGLMVRGGEGGTLVNVASAAAYLPIQPLAAYATTKAAVLALSEYLRIELAPAGVGVVAVCPGVVNTNIVRTTRFVGLDAAAQHAARERASRLYRRRNFSPHRAAREIRRAVERNTAVAPITPEARVGLLAARLSPGLLRALARSDRSGP